MKSLVGVLHWSTLVAFALWCLLSWHRMVNQSVLFIFRLRRALPHCYLTIRMVEGHQCHRTGHNHKKLLGQRFKATSPNARFTDGDVVSCNIGDVILLWLRFGKFQCMLTQGGLWCRRQGAGHAAAVAH